MPKLKHLKQPSIIKYNTETTNDNGYSFNVK